VTTGWQTFSVSAEVPSNSKNLIVAIWTNDATDFLSLAEAGLYRGSSVRAWAPIQTGLDLRACQYFGMRVLPSEINNPVGLGTRLLTTRVSFMFTFPTMRAVPTLTTNISAWSATAAPTTTQAGALLFSTNAAITISGALTLTPGVTNKTSARILFIAGTSFSGSAGEACEVRLGPDVVIFAEAEL